MPWITVASDGASDAAYQALPLSERLPTFESDVSNCELQQLSYFTDADLTTTLTSDHPVQIADDAIPPDAPHPTAKIAYSRDTMFTAAVYVKGQVNGSAHNSTKITVTVCGDEAVTATTGKSPHFLVN